MKAKVNLLVTLSIIVGFYGLVWYRSWLVESQGSSIQSCEGCYQSWTWLMDGWLVLMFITLMAVGIWSRWYWLRSLCRLLVLSLIIIYLVDLSLFKQLSTRLYFYDVLNYFDAAAIKSWWLSLTGMMNLPLLMLISFVIIWFLFNHQNFKFSASLLGLLFVPMVAWAYVALTHKPIRFVHLGFIKNVLAVNLQRGDALPYSDGYKQQVIEKIPQINKLQCDSGLNQKPNIILVVLESFSNYQSQLLSGVNNWTPQLDRLAQQYMYFDDFHANNFNSLGGRVAILTGEYTFRQVAPNMSTMRQGFFNTQRQLPVILKDHGYHSSFLDAADLDYTMTGEYMSAIGFDYVEGNEASFYQGQPRFSFGSVSDEVLYGRVMDFTSMQIKPFFSMVITVSSHHPYIVPGSHEKDLKQVIEYADQAVYDFYLQLKNAGYFEDGLLILTSDHRSMTPLFEEEINRFGERALAKIPLVIIGDQFRNRGLESGFLQQADLLNSIEYLISPSHCYRPAEGNIFAVPSKSAQCVYHSRGDYRDRIDVYCDEGQSYAQIQLSGDATRVVSGQLINEDEIIEKINVTRLATEQRHQAHLKQTEAESN